MNSIVTPIARLVANASETSIVGIVVAKQPSRSIVTKKGTERSLISFTLKDSPRDSINCTCWGSKEYINTLCSEFTIGDVVQVQNAQIQVCSTSDENSKYRPNVSSNFHLNLSEAFSKIVLHDGKLGEKDGLLRVPFRIDVQPVPLARILSLERSFQDQHVTVLAAIKQIGSPRDILTKTSKSLKLCTVTLFDQTEPFFLINMWDNDNVQLAKTWKLRDCVLINDIKIGFDAYRHTLVGNTDSRTVFTLNPNTRDAQMLRTYAEVVDIAYDERNEAPVQSITTVFKVAELQSMSTSSKMTIMGIVYGLLTKLNLDGSSNVITTRCTSCNYMVSQAVGKCTNQNCSAGSGIQAFVPKVQFDIMVDISDHTGTVSGCRFIGSAVETFLGCSVEQFSQHTIDELTALKWRFLLERCKVYFQMSPSDKDNFRNIKILAIEKCDVDDIIMNLH